jgi:glycosyltransferase involved in cell wall biosynthesis
MSQTGTQAITVGIKTFLRTPQLRMCLESLAAHPWHAVIVVDDGPIDATRQQLYSQFSRRLPLEVDPLPFETGLAAGRNEIVARCATEYLLMLDDDQTVPANIGQLTEVLDENYGIGGVSCVWPEHGARKCTACDIRVEARKVVKEIAGDPAIRTTSSGQRYALFDVIPSSTLFRTVCLREQPWDPFYKIGKENLDFYLAHKQLCQWKFAVSLDVEIGHHLESAQRDYKPFRYRERVKVAERYFLQKFGVDEVVEGRKFDDGWDPNVDLADSRPEPPSRLSRVLNEIRRRL